MSSGEQPVAAGSTVGRAGYDEDLDLFLATVGGGDTTRGLAERGAGGNGATGIEDSAGVDGDGVVEILPTVGRERSDPSLVS
jgi:hypothetical protein